MRVVVVGNGVAGIEAALTVRAREPGWPVTVVSEESDDFFSRTALMYVLCGQLSYRDIEPHERGLYERLGFTRVRARAVGVDVEGRALQLAGRSPLPFDRLVIACGSRPRPAPFWDGYDRLRGIGHLVTLQDLAWLEAELHGGPGHGGEPRRPRAHLEHTTEDSPYRFREPARARRGRRPERPVVIGGGLIGIEAVEALLAAGLKPTFLIREDWFWPMAIDGREAAWITERLRHHGVDVRYGHEVVGFDGDGEGNVTGVRTDGGEIGADLVVVAIGVVPNTEWLAGSGLDLDRAGGVVVDDELRAAPSVWAAGDCASVAWHDGSRRPEQLWYTARDQGRIAGANVLGDGRRYARGTWYNAAKLMDIEYTTVGLVDAGLPGEADWFYEETGRVHSTTRVAHVDGRVVGFNLLGRRWDHEVLARWIEERRSLGWVVEHLERARFDTELVPPLRIPVSARPSAAQGGR